MKWKGILLLVCVAISIATFNQRADRKKNERELARLALVAEQIEVEKRFAEATGASKDWLAGAGCDDYSSPIYQAQKAIEETGKALFTVWLDDVVLIDGKPQLIANYRNFSECAFAPNIEVQAVLTEEQAHVLVGRRGHRFEEYLLAIDVSGTYPQERGILVTGNLVALSEQLPTN